MKRIINYILIGVVFTLSFTACEDLVDPEVEKIDYSRVFAPLNLTAKIRNMTTVELAWTSRDDADGYVVELSEDSLLFTSIVKTINVLPNEIPIRVPLVGESLYSVRVKGVNNDGLNDSKWTSTTFRTGTENILTVSEDDIEGTSVVVKWPGGSDVSHFVIIPGNTQRNISEEEKEEGVSTITGLSGDTNYTVKLMRDIKQRGQVSFTTPAAPNVFPEDNLSDIISASEPGADLVLAPGTYNVYTGSITLDKSITIRGQRPDNKPIIQLQFVMANGADDVTIKDVQIIGAPIAPFPNNVFQYSSSGVSNNSLSLIGCVIRNFNRSLFAAQSANISSLKTFLIDNCVLTDILTVGGDFLDFRVGHLSNLTIRNSTFNNCAPARDFIRLDANANYPGKSSNILIENNTFYGVSSPTSEAAATRRLLFVQFIENSSIVKKNIIAATTGYYTSQPATTQPECDKNNYFNAPGYIPGGSMVANVKFDQSGTHTTLDPGFVNAAGGNFKVTNQTLIDNGIGDPRWLQ